MADLYLTIKMCRTGDGAAPCVADYVELGNFLLEHARRSAEFSGHLDNGRFALSVQVRGFDPIVLGGKTDLSRSTSTVQPIRPEHLIHGLAKAFEDVIPGDDPIHPKNLLR